MQLKKNKESFIMLDLYFAQALLSYRLHCR